MKIPKLFKKAAAFVMAAVTALSIMPATAFAAGDIGTISFSHTYDSNGNAMRYNSSANIGGYTAGGTGNYKYRMFVDGENAFCIQPGVPLKTGNTLKKASSDTWNALSANQKKAVGLALLYGYQGNRNNLSGSDDEKWLATQTLVWEFVTGCREATGSYNQTSTTVYSLHFGSNYANSGARAVYDQIVAMLREHNTIPSFMSGGKNDITKELAYKDGKYSITLTDSNGVLSDYSFSSSDSNVSVSKSGNKLTISSTVAISGSVRITAKRNNVPTVSSSAKLIAYGDPNLQDLVTGVENADTVSAYINIETPTGTIALKKTSEDGVVEGISFTIKGDNFNKTVKTGKDGSVSVEGLFPGTYTVTEQSIDRYEPQKTQTVTLIGGKTSTVTFSNTLKRGSLEIVKTSEDNLVEGMKFHLYGTSLSGLPVDEYAVTDKNGLAKFENVLISGDTPYVVEEVDTAVRYVVPASQTAPIEWNKVTKRSFDNVLKKFQVTVTKTDAETGSPQGDASLAGAVYGIYKGEELIDTYTTDENGQFTTKYYICDNDWTVREISPSEGYLLDTAIHKVGAEPELYTVELNSTANDVNEQVIKGNIALIKHTDNGETQIETPEEGAVFDPKGRRNTLKYYFDVSDTHEGYYGSRPVPIWQMDERYEQAVMERLSDRFGDVESTDLASDLMETAKNAVEDNLQDYFSQLKDCTKDSFLEELDDFNIEVIYRRLATNSVAFMLISRCGLDTNEFFDREDFADIVNFNTPATINAIGIATSDIAEMALREISQSIRNVQMAEKDQNRTFAQRTQAQYDKGRQQPERSEYNERNHLQQTGGLSYSRPNITDRARASAWQVRFDAQGLSGEAQASDLSQSADIGQAERASARGRADSTPEVGASDEAALSRAGRDRGTERESTDAVGRTDEQHPQPSGGSDTDRTDLQVSVAKEDEVRVNLPTVDEQIEMIAKAEDEKASAFAISKEDIDSVLQKGSGVADGKYRIYRQFQKGEDRQKNIEFLKNEYGTGGGTHIFPDGFSGHSWYDSKGLAIDRNGTYTNHDLVLKWSQVEKRLRELIKDNRYLNPKEKDHYADYLESVSAPQYEIDTQRKIARQRFIDAHRDLPPADKRDTLALRLSDFIRDLDRYEKDLLSNVERTDLADVTAEQMEQHLSDPATVQQLIDFLAQVQWKTTSVFSRSNAWKFSEELRELHPLRYLYNEGDVVYIGADKYEINNFRGKRRIAAKCRVSLFGKEYSRADFEEKLKENPANDHLKVVVTEKQRTEAPSEKKPDGIQFSIGFSEHPAFYDRQLNDRYTDLSFALGNKLLGVLDEKQHREREGDKNIGWYHKTDFEIRLLVGGEDFHYEGRFDIGDGEGDLLPISRIIMITACPECRLSQNGSDRARTIPRDRWKVCAWGVMSLSRSWSSTPS